MRQWIDYIRDLHTFQLAKQRRGTAFKGEIEIPRVPTKRGPITIDLNQIRITGKMDPDPPFADGINVVSSGKTTEPHAKAPNPAQRAARISFIWGATIGGVLRPYRDDDMPAVVLAIKLSKHYQKGILHRDRPHPAIMADRVVALWYQQPRMEPNRANGPAVVALENYKEYWLDGEFQYHRWTELSTVWDTDKQERLHKVFIPNLSGETDIFGGRYFLDETDEFCYTAEYGR